MDGIHESSIGWTETESPDGERNVVLWRSTNGTREELRLIARADQKWEAVGEPRAPSATPVMDSINAAGTTPPIIR
jgi:hypothetical protein